MLIKGLMELIYAIINIITTPFNIPQLPNYMTGVLDTLYGYVTNALNFISYFCSWDYIKTLLMIIVAIDVAIKLWNFALWVIKKIPMLGIE